MDKIDRFDGEYRFLSNFWPATCWLRDGLGDYPSVEHAYQAAKTTDLEWRKRIRSAESPGEAKRLGRQLPLRADWEKIKLDVMFSLVWQKFACGLGNPLPEKLLATGDAELIEGNWWGDTFWGVCRGKGENHLGKILMEVRRILRTENLEVAPEEEEIP